jgi:hypothetical protein
MLSRHGYAMHPCPHPDPAYNAFCQKEFPSMELFHEYRVSAAVWA